MPNKKVLILAREGLTTDMLFYALSEKFGKVEIILENSNTSSTFQKRISKIGWWRVASQLLFLVFVVPFIKKKKRIKEILNAYDFGNLDTARKYAKYVENVNEKKCLEIIQNIQPDLIFVNGTRIISRYILKNVDAPFINIHVGITPKYRGVHGGYWAIKKNDLAHFGTTVHLIDEGIDTGEVLEQAVIKPQDKDNYATYPILQYAEGIKVLLELIDSDEHFYKNTKPSITKESELHSHPTIWEYWS